jgi:hypothetical protein
MSLFSDIPAGDGKNGNLFLQCVHNSKTNSNKSFIYLNFHHLISRTMFEMELLKMLQDVKFSIIKSMASEQC